MKTSVGDICNLMNRFAPCSLAEEWDNVGLMLGSLDWQVEKVMLALDLSEEVANQAYAQKIDMIITHHPFFFSPMKKLVYNEGNNALVYELIKRQVAVYSAHTNLDSAKGGVNDVLAGLLNLENTQIIKPVFPDRYYKLVVFVPETHADDVLFALNSAGAGHIGNYIDVAYSMEGSGQFRPVAGSNPFIGELDVLEKTKEKRIEVLLKKSELEKTVKMMLEAHPYEEPVYDVFPTENERIEFGLGRIGCLRNDVSLEKFIGILKKALTIDTVAVASADRNVYKVAVCGGSGTDLLDEAIMLGADTLVTGDVKYHIAQKALKAGVNLIDATHQLTEMPVLLQVQKWLEEWAEKNKRNITVCRANEEVVLRYL